MNVYMRLSAKTQDAIVHLFKKYFPQGKLYLFGSRVNDEARGGDIDLLCEQNGDPELYDSKLNAALLNNAYEQGKLLQQVLNM